MDGSTNVPARRLAKASLSACCASRLVRKNMRRGIIALVFRCCVVGGEPHTTNEAAEVAWLSPDQVRELMDEAYATRLLDALRPGPAAVRAHDGLSLLPI